MAWNAGKPALGNSIAADIADIEENFDYTLKSDGTESQVLRRSKLKIEDGTDDNTIKCTVTSEWNGDAIAETDNITKGATTGNFTLNAGGNGLTIEAAGLTGNAIAVLSIDVGYEDISLTGSNAPAYIAPTIVSNDIVLTFTNNSGGAIDITSVASAAEYAEIYITYITSS